MPSELQLFLRSLLDEVICNEKSIAPDGHVNLEAIKAIEHIPQFDFETPNPPIFFEYMPQEYLPPNPEPSPNFKDYDPSEDSEETLTPADKSMRQFMRAMETSNLVDRHTYSVLWTRKLSYQLYPTSSFVVSASFMGDYDTSADFWHTQHFLEPEANIEDGHVYPHITIQLFQSKCGREDKILYGEVIVLLTALRNRASQLHIKSTMERQELEGLSIEELDEYGYAYEFPEEKVFPVLLVSYVGRRRARILYACLDCGEEGIKVKICQSKPYSFERLKDAPIDFFARVLMSHPIRTDSQGGLSMSRESRQSYDLPTRSKASTR
ncbi:hypothetical protein BO78DRAFT_413515 [Aspergillus sclerotiicarbonarius CBS 121057]|uniref:Uncharacterized protein n=1 Tax=Aspergillus sclerotiicarbonarius (strain CBS 121057 / IBT 28362) TaxID=1448318 RepID=A0A319FNC2_ASPSB|nr:hypothetical protein BO78DRAFT_413515 [Aspergillus sclerotiicarbonarius CBS 121057]